MTYKPGDYDKYHASPAAKKDRAARNKARRQAMKSGAVSKGDGKEVDHKNFNPRDNASSNKRVVSRSTNRKRQRGPGKSGHTRGR